MDGDGHGARTGSTISADLAELKRAAIQLAAMIMEWAKHLPKGARRTIAFYVWELLLYGVNERTADDQPMTIRAKFEALRHAIECCVPLEPQKHKGTMVEMVEGRDDSSDIDDDPEAKGKARKKLASLEAKNKRLVNNLEMAHEQIADLTAQVTHLRDMQRKQQTAATHTVPPQTAQPSSALIQHVRELEQERQDIAAQLKEALALAAGQALTIRNLREAQLENVPATVHSNNVVPAIKPAPSKKPTRAPRAPKPDPIKEDRHGLSPWAWGHFKKTAERTGITFEQFRAKVEDGTIKTWRDEQRRNGLLSEYQWRFVAGVAREVAEQLGKAPVLATKPARQKSKSFANPKKSVESSAAEKEVITVGDRKFAESDFLSHAFAKAWYSAVHKETGSRLVTLVMYVQEGTIGQWLKDMDRSSPPERTRRCAVALLRHIANVLGVTPIEKKEDKSLDRKAPQPDVSSVLSRTHTH